MCTLLAIPISAAALLCWLEHFKRPYIKEPLSRHRRKFCLYIREFKGLLREHSTVIIKV